MKRKAFIKIVSIFLVLGLVLNIAACAQNSDTTEESASETDSVDEVIEEAVSVTGDYELTFVCPIVGLEYWDMCAEGIAKADAEFGTSTQIIGPSDASSWTTEVIDYMEAAISSQPDGIMLYAGLEVLMPLIDRSVNEANIPTIAIDSDAPDSARMAYVGTDPYNAGYASGEALIAATGGTAKVCILSSSLSAEKEMAEVEAFKDAVADYDIEILTMEETGGDLATGVTKMQALVQTYPEMTAVLGTFCYDVQAAAKVKEEMGLDDLVLVGYDDQEETLEYIRKGLVDAIIVQDPYMMGYLGVKTLYQIISGETLEQDSIDTGTVTVTIDNVDSYK